MIRYVNDALDCSVWAAPTRKRITEDGEIVVEKLPTMSSVLVLDSAGNSRRVPRTNGGGKASPNNPYWSRLKPLKEASGMIPYGKCPKREGLHEHLPANMRGGEPCKISADGNPVSDDHPCACIVKLQVIRQTRDLKRFTEDEARWSGKDAKAAAKDDAIIEFLRANMKQDGAETDPKEPRGKRAKE